MKKKLFSFLTSLLIVFSMVIPGFADEKSYLRDEKESEVVGTDFVKNLMEIYKNDAVTSKIKTEVDHNETDGESKYQTKFDLNTITEFQNKNGLYYIEMKVSNVKILPEDRNQNLTPPVAKIFIKKDGIIYIGRDIVKYFLGDIERSNVYSKDYIRIDREVLKDEYGEYGIFGHSLDNIGMFSDKISYLRKVLVNIAGIMDREKIIDIKKDKNSYSVDLSSVKMIDSLYDILKWTFSSRKNFDTVREILEIKKETDSLTNQDIDDIKSALLDLKDNGFLTLIKGMIFGSRIKYSSNFDKDSLNEDVRISLKINNNYDVYDYKKVLRKPEDINISKLEIKNTQNTKVLKENMKKEPESFYNLTKKDVEDIKKLPENAYIFLSEKQKNLRVDCLNFDTENQNIKIENKDGSVFMKKSDMEKIFFVNINSNKEMIPVKELEKHRYKVEYKKDENFVEITRKRGYEK